MTAALFSALLACLIAASAVAQSPCCAPRQFEGLVSMRYGTNNTFFEAFSSLSFDYTNQLTASNETLISSRETRRQRVLVNGTSRTMYIVDHHSSECRILTLEHGLDPPCVPSSFRPEGTFHFGAANDRLDFSNFRGRIGEVDAMIATSRATCIPISQMTFYEREHFHEVRSFVNVTLGIRNRGVFNVPPECRRAGIRTQRPKSIRELRAAFPLLRNFFLGYFQL